MQVLMTHPDHGKLHVYDQAELSANEALGWTAVYDVPVVAEPAPSAAAAVTQEDVFGEEEAEQVAPPAAIPAMKKRK